MNATEEQIRRENKNKEQARIFANQITVARGHLEHGGYQGQYEYGYLQISFWIPRLQQWVLSDNTFIVTGDNYEDARALFWDKWQSYIQRRFNLKYIQIENIWTLFNQHISALSVTSKHT